MRLLRRSDNVRGTRKVKVKIRIRIRAIPYAGFLFQNLILLHSETSIASVFAAFAGLVEGNASADIPSVGRIYLSYNFCAVFPLTNIFSTDGNLSRSPFISFTVTFLTDASDEPSISQLSMTSQSAMRLRLRNSFFSFVCG